MQLSHLTRQLDVIPYELISQQPIHVIGCGAIGSFTTLLLSKMGAETVTIWDFDEVSVENMSCQFFRFKDIGQNKAKALQSLTGDFAAKCVEVANGKAFETKKDELKGIVIFAVDSMKARKEIWEDILARHIRVSKVIDARMGLEDCSMYVMNPFEKKDVDAYEATLYSDESAVQERCTAKATIYTAAMLSGLIAKAVKNIVCNEVYPRTTQWNIGKDALISWNNKGQSAIAQ